MFKLETQKTLLTYEIRKETFELKLEQTCEKQMKKYERRQKQGRFKNPRPLALFFFSHNLSSKLKRETGESK